MNSLEHVHELFDEQSAQGNWGKTKHFTRWYYYQLRSVCLQACQDKAYLAFLAVVLVVLKIVFLFIVVRFVAVTC